MDSSPLRSYLHQLMRRLDLAVTACLGAGFICLNTLVFTSAVYGLPVTGPMKDAQRMVLLSGLLLFGAIMLAKSWDKHPMASGLSILAMTAGGLGLVRGLWLAL